ncbi:hypothetical protein BSN85_08780 [Bradyrhizobium brasilense]|nr:hypothetical protein BSN85_08780 [Bradyrhizobium brasilense]
MLIALISTDYPPLRTSAAVQLHDLARNLVRLGHDPVVIVPSSQRDASWTLERIDGVRILRVHSPPTRAASRALRAISEMLLPFSMYLNIRRSPFRSTRWDLLVWYSPPIFFGPLVARLRRASGARTYLILRDIFPEWALDIGLMRRGLVYLLFKIVAAIQYFVADTIGVQTRSNLAYVSKWARPTRRLEVLHNWLTAEPNTGCSIEIDKTRLAGRTIFVYIGNMGVAQGLDLLMDVIGNIQDRQDIGFLFVGRGTEFALYEARFRERHNVMFHPEIPAAEIPGLLIQCHVGLVTLHPEHRTHNIPGKFVSYVQYGLPVLARVSEGTDLQRLIEESDIGKVYFGSSVRELRSLVEQLADAPALRHAMSSRCKKLGQIMFSSEAAARQIVASAGAGEGAPRSVGESSV